MVSSWREDQSKRVKLSVGEFDEVFNPECWHLLCCRATRSFMSETRCLAVGTEEMLSTGL